MRLTRRQVPILDLCERLKAAGVSQRETYWVWQKNSFGGWILTHNKLLQQGLMGENKDIKYSKFLVDAPTVAELGEMLPAGISDGDIYYWLKIGRASGRERV